MTGVGPGCYVSSLGHPLRVGVGPSFWAGFSMLLETPLMEKALLKPNITVLA